MSAPSSTTLPVSWASLPALAALLDPDRLTELFGAALGGPLRTGALRYKPGVSAVARAEVPATGAVHWVATFAPGAAGRPGKLDKVVSRGRARAGADAVLVRELPDGSRLAVGRIGADPDLGAPLGQCGQDLVRDLGRAGAGPRLLRYNPRRRVVLTGADGDGATVVTKVTAGPAPADPVLLTRLAAAGIPVLAPVATAGLPRTDHALHYPWFGDGDLAGWAGSATAGAPRAVAQAAAEAGAALARLHVLGPAHLGVPGAGPGGSPDALAVGAPLDPGRKLGALAADLTALDPGLAARLARAGRAAAQALEALPGAPHAAGLLHGDFSADQVLVRRRPVPGRARLVLADLDRMRTGAAADDLGSFVAVEQLDPLGRSAAVSSEGAGTPLADGLRDRSVVAPPGPADVPHGAGPLADALLAGYGAEAASIGGAAPDRAAILVWAAVHVLGRAMAPFRATTPDWRQRTAERIALAERLLRAAGRSGRTPRPAVVPRVSAAAQEAVPGDPALSPGPGAAPGGASRPRSACGSADRPVPHPVPETVPGHGGTPLRVQRAWPGTEGRLVLELEDERGRVRAAESVPGPAGGRTVRVSPYGRDPRLPGLAEAAAHGRVLVHRHRRRAVVRTPEGYVKLLAGGRAERVAELTDRFRGPGRAAGFAVPAVLARAEDRVVFSALEGRSLHELGAAGDEPAWRAAWAAWARGWPALAADRSTAGALPEHGAEDEARTLRQWAARLEAFPGVLEAPPGTAAALADRIEGRLAEGRATGRAGAVLHRDLHDKQLLFDGARLGLLDVDTAARGEAALDLANLAVHLDLRVAQGLLAPRLRDVGREAVDAVADELGVASGRLDAYAEATRLRLACVYAFRPRWASVARQLLDALR